MKAFRTPHGVVFSELARHDILGRIDIPCGVCVGCLKRRADDWALRVMHEASCWSSNCFVTLTYGRDRLPPGGSLDHRDVQLFLKRLRKHFCVPVRYFMCGEYGPLNLRPHYHACLFNVSFGDCVVRGKSGAGVVFSESATLNRLWSHGMCTVQELVPQTAFYCAKYTVKHLNKPGGDIAAYARPDADGVLPARRPEYAAMSLKPGIGSTWFELYRRDIYPHDFAIMDGTKRRPPKFYDKLERRARGLEFEQIEFARAQRGRAAHADNTDERLRVREVVAMARFNLNRGDLDDAS